MIVDGVYHQVDMVCWLPRDRYTRVQARHRFWRETNAAGWNVEWTRIRVVARFLHPFPHRHPDEGLFQQCDRDTDGNTQEFNCWCACFDADDSPYMDASGSTPELALASLAQKLASALLDEKALARAEAGT